MGHILLAVILGAAAVGLLVGLRDGVPVNTGRPQTPPHNSTPQHGGSTHNTPHNTATQQQDVPDAVAYADLIRTPRGPNAAWRSHLPTATNTPPANKTNLFTVADGAGTADRSDALTQRAAIRAYDGAPPVVPHAIDQRNPASCVACHGQGLRLGDVVAPRMSHGILNNCTQCHAESKNSGVAFEPRPKLGDNTFVGRDAPGPGQRAWQGAPPTIPHSTWMRQNCSSCHGPQSEISLQTSHPWRTNCTQCHAPSAELEHRAALPASRPNVANWPPAESQP